MYVDFRDDRPFPEPWKPEKPKRRLSKRQEDIVAWVIGLNLLMLLLAPLAGFTVIDAIIALVRH